MPTLHICLLGEFTLRNGAESAIRMDTPRLQSLLAYLVLLHRNVPISRQRLAFLMWPDTQEAQARTNLRNLLHQLRKKLPDEGSSFLDFGDMKAVQWRRNAPFSLDVIDFEQLAASANRHLQEDDREAACKALEEAISLYRGDLLPGCYDEWIEPERERLRVEYIRTLDHLITLLEDQRDVVSAIRYARRLLQSNPLDEGACLRLMRLYVRNNELASAVSVYRDCEKRLKRELNLTPSPELELLYQNLLQRHVSDAPSTVSSTGLMARWPLVDRQIEWKALMVAWDVALHRRAHLVLLSGEAGIGKTRLAEELLSWASQKGIAFARAQSHAIGRVAYDPVSDWLRAPPFGIALRRLEPIWLTEVARILPELLAQHPKLHPPAPLTDSWQRKRFFDALVKAVLFGNRPLLLLLDDLQWCDQETLEWLHYLLRSGSTAQLLLVGALRKEIKAEPMIQPFLQTLRRSQMVTEIELTPLTEVETARLIAHVTGRKIEPSAAAHLYRETEGNPLFVVEAARAELWIDHRVQDAGAPEHSTSLPPLIRTVIDSRLGQLSPAAREVANLAATIGREFALDVLVYANNGDLDSVAQGLDELGQRQIIREQEQGHDFSHDKIREVLYAGLSSARRRLLHQRIAQALEVVHASNLDAVSGQVAVHYARAAMPDKAVTFYQRAADVAQRVYAHEEASQLLTMGLEVLRTAPKSATHDQQELDLLTSLGLTLMVIRGYASPAVEECYSRIAALCKRLSRRDQLFDAQLGLWVGFLVRGRLRDTLDLAQQLHDQASHMEDPYRLLIGHTMLGMSYFHLGQPVDARHHLDTAIALVRNSPQRLPVNQLYSFLGVHFEVNLLAYNQLVAWLLGDVDQALQMSEASLTLARQAQHPYSQDYALAFAIIFRLLRREATAASEQVAQAIELSTVYGFLQWGAHETILQGRTLVEAGRVNEGIAQMHKGLERWQATGARLAKSYYLGLLAEAHATAGQVDTGLAVLAEAMAYVEANHEGWWMAELHRVKGELLLQQDSLDAAEAEYAEAVAIAAAQRAKSLELRAVARLARLWQRQGESAKARRKLAECLAGFTEGFDTGDLQDANALLVQ